MKQRKKQNDKLKFDGVRRNMNNIKKVTDMGICTGCGSCVGCEHIKFKNNELGFPAPIVDENCKNCGECLKKCIYWDAENN